MIVRVLVGLGVVALLLVPTGVLVFIEQFLPADDRIITKYLSRRR